LNGLDPMTIKLAVVGDTQWQGPAVLAAPVEEIGNVYREVSKPK